MNTENIEQPGIETSDRVEDLLLNEVSAEKVKGGVIMALLLPAVQKV